MGVKQYTWATSPLRRYVDLVNQWQIIACARHGRMAALAAPFKPKDAELFSVISGFDAAYSAYNDFQRGIERYWTLRHLEQAGIRRTHRQRDDGRPGALPMCCRWCSARSGAENLPRGAHVKVRITGLTCSRWTCMPAWPSASTTSRPHDCNRRRSRGTGSLRRVRSNWRSICRMATMRTPTCRRPPRLPRPTDGTGCSSSLHPPDRIDHFSGRPCGPADGALCRPRELQPRLRGHAARGHPG